MVDRLVVRQAGLAAYVHSYIVPEPAATRSPAERDAAIPPALRHALVEPEVFDAENY